MKKKLIIVLLLIIAISWMICIFKLSGMNSKNSNGKSKDIIGIFIEDTLDITNNYGITDSHPSDKQITRASQLINPPMRKVIHATVYFVLAFLSMALWNYILGHNRYIVALIISFIVCAIFAISDEFHQTFVDGRTGQILDVIIDSAGAVVGLLFYSTYHIIYKLGYKNGKNSIEKSNEKAVINAK